LEDILIMTKQSPLPTTLSEAQRVQALERFAILRPALEEGVPQTQIARTHQLPLSTVQRWIKRYREYGLAGLAHQQRSDRGKPRGIPSELVQVIEGLAMQTPPRSVTAIHRQVAEVAKQHGCKPPSYSRIYQIVCCARKVCDRERSNGFIKSGEGAACYDEVLSNSKKGNHHKDHIY
jgi:transposase-like protein